MFLSTLLNLPLPHLKKPPRNLTLSRLRPRDILPTPFLPWEAVRGVETVVFRTCPAPRSTATTSVRNSLGPIKNLFIGATLS